MARISIIGFGNVAHHLALAFEAAAAIELVQVYSRSKTDERLPYSAKITNDLNGLQPADLYIISVTDSAVAQVSASLPFSGKLVAHTAGSLPLSELDARNRSAVFYPLQTFSKNKPVDFASVPICIEAENDADLATVEFAARAISQHVFRIDSQQRKALHVSAVFVSNFSNHMYKLASDICAEHAMPFDILKPLILETAAKVQLLSPKEAQTGPAKRRDQNTIDAHLALLSDPNQKDLYQRITNSIQHER